MPQDRRCRVRPRPGARVLAALRSRSSGHAGGDEQAQVKEAMSTLRDKYEAECKARKAAEAHRLAQAEKIRLLQSKLEEAEEEIAALQAAQHLLCEQCREASRPPLELAEAAERERCAKVCDSYSRACAKAIRALRPIARKPRKVGKP